MNDSFEKIAQILREHESFVILSHIRPDGDAIGSTLAMGLALELMGKKVTMLNDDGVPESLAFVPGAEKLKKADGSPVDADVAIAVDCATKPRLGELSLQSAAGAKLWVNVDHHISNPGYGDYNLVVADHPATGELLYHFFKESGLTMDTDVAVNLYTGVVTDTGGFRYRGTTAATLRMAAEMADLGVDIAGLSERLFSNHPLRRVELTKALLNTMVLSDDGKIADWYLTTETKQRLALVDDDTEGQIDMIRSIEGVEIALFFEELGEGMIRVSLRAKEGDVDCSVLAQQFGGGGHMKAAGIRMAGELQEVRTKLLEAARAAL